MIPTIWHSEKDKTMATVERSVVARGLDRERVEQAEHRGFYGRESILDNTLMVDTCLYMCQNT